MPKSGCPLGAFWHNSLRGNAHHTRDGTPSGRRLSFCPAPETRRPRRRHLHVSSKAKNYLIVLLAASTVSAGLLAWNQNRRLTALEADLLKASASAAKVKAKPAPVSDTSAPAAATALVETAAPATEEPAAPANNRQRNNNRPNFGALMANPEFAKAVSIQQRAALDNRYAALFKQLNLSPDQLEKFKSLLLERQNARMDVMTAARENGLNPRESRDEINKLVTQAQAEVDANIKNTLGEGVYSQYQNYDSTQSQRAVVSQLDQRLSYSSTPLNSTQTSFLVNALAASGTTESGDQGGGPGGWGGGTRGAAITDAVIQQAQSVLTPDQVAALKQLQAEQKAQQQIRELIRNNGGQQARPAAGN